MKNPLRLLVIALLAVAGCAASSGDETRAGEAAIAGGDRIDIVGDHIVIPQHSTWTIQRGASERSRIVGYGDSIFAGYKAAAYEVARRQAVYVAGEYLAKEWSSDVEVVVRALSGAVSAEVLAHLEAETGYMTDPERPARAIFFEMCGNDYLQARSAWSFAPGECDYTALDAAVDTCAANVAAAMDVINSAARPGAMKVIANLYYPGFAIDGQNKSFCRDSSLGRRPFIQDVLLPRMARSNWRMCDLARRKGFRCVDAFAEFMAADVDTNADGVVDAEAIRVGATETEDEYVQKIAVTLRSTLRDARRKHVAPTLEPVYIQGDDVHPTYVLDVLALDPETGEVVGQGAPDFLDAQIVDGKNPKWNLAGHERMGWAMANPRGPASGASARSSRATQPR